MKQLSTSSRTSLSCHKRGVTDSRRDHVTYNKKKGKILSYLERQTLVDLELPFLLGFCLISSESFESRPHRLVCLSELDTVLLISTPSMRVFRP